MPGFAFPPVGPVGLSSPPSRSVFLSLTIGTMLSYDYHLPFLGRFAVHYRSPIPLPASIALCPSSLFPFWFILRLEAPEDAEALVQPVPFLFWRLGGRQMAIPSSRVIPLNTCPDLGSRWYPGDSPFRLQDCCLPLSECVGFPSSYSGYPSSTFMQNFEILCHGLCPCSTQFHTPITGFACEFCYRPAG